MMRALLKTRCGCTRMIDIVDRYPVIRIPFDQTYSVLYHNDGEAVLKGLGSIYRTFRYDRYVVIDNLTVLIYIEEA
jgi:hypothetical protein